MKGYNKPDKIEAGVCIVCKKRLDDVTAYSHYECAMVWSAAQDRKIEEARYGDKDA